MGNASDSDEEDQEWLLGEESEEDELHRGSDSDPEDENSNDDYDDEEEEDNNDDIDRKRRYQDSIANESFNNKLYPDNSNNNQTDENEAIRLSNNFGDVDTISRRTRAQLSLAGQDIEELSSFLNEDEDEIIERDFEIYKEFLQDFRISHGFGAENQKEDEFTAFHNDIDSIVQGTSTLPLDGSSPTNSRRRRPSSLVEKGQRRWKKQGRPRRDSSNNKRDGSQPAKLRPLHMKMTYPDNMAHHHQHHMYPYNQGKYVLHPVPFAAGMPLQPSPAFPSAGSHIMGNVVVATGGIPHHQPAVAAMTEDQIAQLHRQINDCVQLIIQNLTIAAGSDYGLPNGTVANHLESYPHSSDHPPRSSSHSEEEMKMGQAVIKDSIDLLIKMANSCESAYMARSPLVHSVATTAWSGLRVRQPNNASSVFKVPLNDRNDEITIRPIWYMNVDRPPVTVFATPALQLVVQWFQKWRVKASTVNNNRLGSMNVGFLAALLMDESDDDNDDDNDNDGGGGDNNKCHHHHHHKRGDCAKETECNMGSYAWAKKNALAAFQEIKPASVPCAEPRLKAALANFEQRVIERAKARAGLDAFDRIESYWNAYLPNHRFLDANVQDHLREHILASTKDRTQFFLKRLTGLLRKRDNVMTQPALVFPFDFSHPYMSTSPPPPSSYGRWNEFANVYCVNGLQFIEKVVSQGLLKTFNPSLVPMTAREREKQRTTMKFFKTANFCPAEDRLLAHGLTRFKENWTKIRDNLLPNRTAEQIRSRKKNLYSRRGGVIVANDENSQEYRKTTLEHVEINVISKALVELSWPEVAELLPDRDPSTLKQLWEARQTSDIQLKQQQQSQQPCLPHLVNAEAQRIEHSAEERYAQAHADPRILAPLSPSISISLSNFEVNSPSKLAEAEKDSGFVQSSIRFASPPRSFKNCGLDYRHHQHPYQHQYQHQHQYYHQYQHQQGASGPSSCLINTIETTNTTPPAVHDRNALFGHPGSAPAATGVHARPFDEDRQRRSPLVDLGWQNYQQHHPRVKRSLNDALLLSSSPLSPQQAVQNSRRSTDHGHAFAPDASAVVETTNKKVDGAPVSLSPNDTLRKGKVGAKYASDVNQGEKQFETEELEESSSDEGQEDKRGGVCENRDSIVIKPGRERAEDKDEDEGEESRSRLGQAANGNSKDKTRRLGSVTFEQEELSSDEDD